MNSKNDLEMVKAYAGESITKIGNKEYFLKDCDLFTIDETGQEEWIFSHANKINAFCFHSQSECLFFATYNEESIPESLRVEEKDDETVREELAILKEKYPKGFQSIIIYDLNKNEILSEEIMPNLPGDIALVSVSDDLSTLATITAFPSNELSVFRLLRKEELELLTSTPIIRPEFDLNVNISEQKAILSPWLRLEFSPNNSEHFIIISRYEAAVGVIQYAGHYTFVTVREIGSNFKKDLPQDFDTNMLFDSLFSKTITFSDVIEPQYQSTNLMTNQVKTSDGIWESEELHDNNTFMSEVLRDDIDISVDQHRTVLPKLENYCSGDINMVNFPEHFTKETIIMNEKIEYEINNIYTPVELSFKTVIPQRTSPRDFALDLLSEGEIHTNLLKHADYTGECGWLGEESIFYLVCRNFGIILCKIPEFPVDFESIVEEEQEGKTAKTVLCEKHPIVLFPPSPRFCILDLDYNFVVESEISQDKIEQLTDLEMCLGDGNFQTFEESMNVIENTLFNKDFKGDRRIISAAFDESYVDDHVGLICGYEDSSVRWYLLKIKNEFSDDIIKPEYTEFYSNLGPVREIKFSIVSSESSIYNAVDSSLNNVFITTFVEGLYYLPPEALRENSKFTALSPMLISEIFGSITLNGINLRSEFLKSLISMKLLSDFTEDGATINKYELENLCIENFCEFDNKILLSMFTSEYVSSLIDSSNESLVDSYKASINRNCAAIFPSDEGKQIIIFGSSDSGRLYSYENNNSTELAHYVTARLPLTILDEKWYVPDPILSLDSIEECKIIITGHASGYVRFWNIKNDGSIKMINRMKISDLPIVHICLVPSGNYYIFADTACKIFFVSGLQTDCLIEGFLCIRETNNLMPFDLSSNLMADTFSLNEYVNNKFEKLIICLSDVVNDLAKNGVSKEEIFDNMSVISCFSKSWEEKRSESLMNLLQKFIKDKSSIDLKELEELTKNIKPLSSPFIDRIVPHYYEHIVSIKATCESFYVALSTGDIIKYQYMNKERFFIMKENIECLESTNFLEFISESSNKELELMETRFISMVNEAKINPADLKPFVIHTNNAISTIAIDPCIIPPPCVMEDIVYVGLYDGRVLCYAFKSIGDDVEEIENLNKIDFPLSGSNAIVNMGSEVEEIEVSLDGVLIISDSIGNIVLTNSVVPIISSLKKVSNSVLKEDDLQQIISSNDISIPEFEEFEQKIIMYDPLSKYFKSSRKEDFIQMKLSNKASYSRMFKYNNSYSLFIFNEYQDMFEITIPSDFCERAEEKIADVDHLCKEFVSSTLQMSIDGNMGLKEELKLNFEARTRNRLNSLAEDEILTINQQLLETAALLDGPLDDKHEYTIYPAEHFTYKCSIELSEFLNTNQTYEHDDEVYDETKTAEELKRNIEEQLDKINLMSLPFNEDVSFENCGRLVGLVISSHLRSRINETLIEESEKIAESCREIDYANEEVLISRNLIVVPETNNIRFLEQLFDKIENDENSKFDFSNIRKLLNASSRLSENELRISEGISNLAKSELLEKVIEYEKSYKEDVLSVLTYLYELVEARVECKSKDATEDVVSGIEAPSLFVADYPIPSNIASIRRKIKHSLLLRSAQVVSERARIYLPYSLVEQEGSVEAERVNKFPTEKEEEALDIEYESSFVLVGFENELENKDGVSEAFESYVPFSTSEVVEKDDPFHLVEEDEVQEFSAGTINKVLKFGCSPSVRSELVPFSVKPELMNAEDTEEFIEENISQIPNAIEFLSHGSLSCRKALFNESEIAFNVRSKQQFYILEYISILVAEDINLELQKAHQAKSRCLTKIEETVEEIKDISKELVYHAKEETLENLITKTREELFEEYKAAGVSTEEAAEKASKNVIESLPSDEEVADLAMNLIDIQLLDISTIVGCEECELKRGKESAVLELGFDPNFEQKGSKDNFLYILKNLAINSNLEKFSNTLLEFGDEIKSNIEKNDVVEKAIEILSDEGIFNIEHLSTLIERKEEELKEDNSDIDPDIIKMAIAYKRALYDMMRGSIDASNKVTVRDLPIPTTLGLNEKTHKLSKEEVAENEEYLEKLLDIDEQRQKEKKSLVAECVKLRELAGELSREFDENVLYELRNRRFNSEILIESLELNSVEYLYRSISYLRNEEKLTADQEMKLIFEQLVVKMDSFKENLTAMIHEEASRKENLEKRLSTFLTRVMKNELKECNEALIQFIKKPIDVEALRNKIKEELQEFTDVNEIINKDGINIQSLINVSQTAFSTFYQKDGEIDAIHREVLEYEEELINLLLERQFVIQNKNESEKPFEKSQPIVNEFADFIFPSGFVENNEQLSSILKNGDVNIVYAELISKLIPANSIEELQSGTKINFHTAEAEVFDCCRCFKSLMEIEIFECQKRFEMLNYFNDSMNSVLEYTRQKSNELLEQISDYEEVINDEFINIPLVSVFELGELEAGRTWEELVDKVELIFDNVLISQNVSEEQEQEDDLLLKDDSLFLIVNRDLIDQINDQLIELGKERIEKLELLAKEKQSERCLEHSVHMKEWDKNDVVASTKDFEMIRVSKEMHDIIRENSSTVEKKSKEVNIMTHKLEHARKSHAISMNDRDTELRKVPAERRELELENQILQQKIEDLRAKNEQRKQALPDYAQSINETEADSDDAQKKFRRIAALRKMRELSKAQEEEMEFLISELDKLRERTYPTFE